jgi:hypothetical protein
MRSKTKRFSELTKRIVFSSDSKIPALRTKYLESKLSRVARKFRLL